MSGARSISLVGRFVSSGGGFWLPIRLPLPLHRVRIEGVGVAGSEGRAGGDQDVVEAAIEVAAGAHLNARGIDTLFLSEVLRDVESALRCGIRCFIGRMLADNNQFGGRVAVEGESNLVKAALGLVVDANRPFSIAFEGDAAEAARQWCYRGRRSCDGDRGVRGGLLAEVVDDVASNVDCAWRRAGGDEGCRLCAAGDLAGGGRVRVGQSAVLRAIGDRRNSGGIARHYRAGIS
jgi:hypothetical protein